MKIRLGKFLEFGILAFALTVWATGWCWAKAAGSNVFDFLSMSRGARQLAMGGSGVAVADDLYGSNLNPAALGRLWQQEISLHYTRWFQGVDYEFLGYAHPTLHLGTFAGSVFQMGYGEIQGLDASGKKTGIVQARDFMGKLSYGRPVFDSVWAGINLKYIDEKLHTQRAQALAGDLGILYRPQWTGWLSKSSLGLSLLNLGTRPRFVSEGSDLPLTLQAGMAFRPFFEGLTLSGDLVKVRAEEISARIGVEYLAKDVVAFRTGYNSAYDLGRGISFGFGVKAWGLQLDYAYAGFAAFGDTHHLGLTFRFGSIAEKYYERGMKALRQEDYASAIVEFGRVITLDHQHRRALLRIREANKLFKVRLNRLKH